MAKRSKRLEKGIESIKAEIEKHFAKLEKDIEENQIDRGRYHVKEIDLSLLAALELKMNILNIEDNSLEEYRKRLEILKKKLSL